MDKLYFYVRKTDASLAAVIQEVSRATSKASVDFDAVCFKLAAYMPGNNLVLLPVDSASSDDEELPTRTSQPTPPPLRQPSQNDNDDGMDSDEDSDLEEIPDGNVADMGKSIIAAW
jgi:hypothetical protein